MEIFCRILVVTSLVAAALLAGAASHVQPHPTSAKSEETSRLQVGHVDYSQSLESLLEATQQLGDAIQQLAQQDPGPERTAAIDAAHDALLQTN